MCKKKKAHWVNHFVDNIYEKRHHESRNLVCMKGVEQRTGAAWTQERLTQVIAKITICACEGSCICFRARTCLQQTFPSLNRPNQLARDSRRHWRWRIPAMRRLLIGSIFIGIHMLHQDNFFVGLWAIIKTKRNFK